ncbi:uncharacterized protein [Dipodomys merriami]|uniref:uncharacterized protein n=1 Tax=Dipodomys merriami TaxID=94247 RepID=UPI003855CA9F
MARGRTEHLHFASGQQSRGLEKTARFRALPGNRVCLGAGKETTCTAFRCEGRGRGRGEPPELPATSRSPLFPILRRSPVIAAPRTPPTPDPRRALPGSSMGGARDAGWVAAGLVLGAGACYCFYRLTRGPRRGGRGRGLRPSRSAARVWCCALPSPALSPAAQDCTELPWSSYLGILSTAPCSTQWIWNNIYGLRMFFWSGKLLAAVVLKAAVLA